MFPISLIQETCPKDPCPKLGTLGGIFKDPSRGPECRNKKSVCPKFLLISHDCLRDSSRTPDNPKPCKRNFFRYSNFHPYSPSSFIINKSHMIIIHEWERQHWQRLELWTPLEPQVNFFSLLFRASSFHLPWFAFSSPEFFLLIFCLLLEYLQ